MAEYRAYKGYYVGSGCNDFHSDKEIDSFILSRLRKQYERACAMFARHPDMEHSIHASQIADQLAAAGMTWAEIESIEAGVN